ncbi:hypothetical protein SOVF_194420 [Spinacia oleracea]|nr:hypothetical protein SOVF_194420 [Spinacia oleracea]
MASEKMTEYERKRLENIKRNNDVMASLKIQSHAADLSASSKRLREKSYYKATSKKRKTPEPESPIVIRRSPRTRGMPPDLSGLPESFKDSSVKPTKSSWLPQSSLEPSETLSMEQAYEGEGSHLRLIEKLGRLTRNTKSEDENGYLNLSTEFERVHLEEPVDPRSLKLEYDNVARVVPGRIVSIRFLPTAEMTMVVVGNKNGYLGFWDVKPQNEEEDVIHLSQPHSAPISGISVHPFSLSKVYSCCYDGFLRMIDIEREKFELVYSSTDRSFLLSVAQQPNDVNSVYFGEGPGGLNMFDKRAGEISFSLYPHVGRINSIDFSQTDTNILATSSTDGFACLWDLRKMDVKIKADHPEGKALWNVKHKRAVHSAYFSPSGRCVATTSLDDTIGVLGGVNFEDTFMIPHDNLTNRWISTFRAVWGWDDTHLYVGNMKRRVDVLSVTKKKMVHTLESSHMTAIPCRYDAHPCNVGMLAGATSGGQVYIWTSSS